MAFHSVYQPCRFPEIPLRRTPAARDAQKFPSNPLAETEPEAVTQVLRFAIAIGPDENGRRSVTLDDGVKIQIFGSDLSEGCSVTVGTLTAQSICFLFALLKAGKWIMLPATGDLFAISAATQDLNNKPEDFFRLVTIRYLWELRLLLTDGLSAWEECRRRLADGSYKY